SIAFPKEYVALPPSELSRLGLSQVMTITSTYDHRVIQGAESGAFLAYLDGLLQGQNRFYEDIFADLGVAHPPLSMTTDSSPRVGVRDSRIEDEVISKEASVIQMIRAYRVRGHLIADINPLFYSNRDHEELAAETYGLTLWDLDRRWITGGLAGQDVMTLREILDVLWKTYTRKVGVEFMHISGPAEKRWIHTRVESTRMEDPLSLDDKLRILSKLNAAEAFEQFLQRKYIGHKRFSLEGAETVIPILDMILNDAADQGVEEVVMGMAHRGRLNVLANTLGKPYSVIFSEFEGNLDTAQAQGSGDVKYHLGAKGEHESPNGGTVTVTLAANPSHLEAVNPVVEGMVRAKQLQHWEDELHELDNYDQVLPILIHGDAAFAGQGVVAETLNLSQLRGYTTGGTIHVIINNQIGFTTSPIDARSSTYATDVARMIQAPIFHVNGDDPEAAVRVARLALDYRQVYNKDVVIDLICYRVHGHNEGDEPTYTQPLLYDKIRNKRSVRKLYTEALVRRGDIDLDKAEQMLDDFQGRLQQA
ncbi:MAG: thiamine pyrophosphate-dependent enzyme, partial [Bacteroidota bacterium]